MIKMKVIFQISLLASLLGGSYAFTVSPRPLATCVSQRSGGVSPLYLSSEKSDSEIVEAEFESLSDEEKKEAVGNLVADDEWNGLSMELSEIVRIAVIEDIKKTTRDFIGKDDYNVGDIAKEVDGRVKKEIATLRGKEGKYSPTFWFGALGLNVETTRRRLCSLSAP